MTAFKKAARALAHRVGIQRKPAERFSNPVGLSKADMFVERFREVVSDPLNLLVERVPEAGYVDDRNCVILHNGNRVPVRGDFAYYSEFSDVLIINRGVHEPLEEFCFQTVLQRLPAAPVMLELGAYWAHYSMWLQKKKPAATCFMVEPDAHNLECGRRNFELNGCKGEFIHAFVSDQDFQVDKFTGERGLGRLDILHADIQGYELAMVNGASRFLSGHGASYVFVSTHGEQLHRDVAAKLREFGYRVEIDSGYDTHTTSFDGFLLATAPHAVPVFEGFTPLGRTQIANSSPRALLDYLTSIR